MARASRWQWALVMGLCCGGGAGVGTALAADPGWSGLLPVGAAAVGGGLVGATVVHGKVRRQTEAVGVLPTPVRRAAGRASLWGAVPRDARTRAAALALAQHTLAEQRRGRVVGVAGSLVFVAFLVNAAIQASPEWWIGVVLAIGGLGYGWLVLPGRLCRRIELLREEPPAP